MIPESNSKVIDVFYCYNWDIKFNTQSSFGLVIYFIFKRKS